MNRCGSRSAICGVRRLRAGPRAGDHAEILDRIVVALIAFEAVFGFSGWKRPSGDYASNPAGRRVETPSAFS
ncbi:MAG: hypothetical protein ACO3YY_06730, partial [Phycisphaerales bacterium]